MKFLSFFFVFILSTEVSAKQLPFSTKADSYILINADTGAVLSEKNSKKLQYPASLTKIATCSYAINQAGDKLDVVFTAERDALVTITEAEMKKMNYTHPHHWLEPVATHIGLKVGEKMSLRDLLYGAMIASGGDACNVIAQNIGGNIPNFMEGLNKYLNSIGCKDTVYYNTHGINHPNHQTTAYDLSLMTKEALKDPFFRKIVKSTSFNRPETNKQKATIYAQSNRLLRKGTYYYPKAIGVKTGFHTPAKHCLAAAATQDGRTLIAIFLKHPERGEAFVDAKLIFEKAFQEKKVHRTLVQAGPQKHTKLVIGGASPLTTYVDEPAIISYYPAEESIHKCFLCWDELTLPIKKGERVGEISIKDESGHIVKRTILLADADVHPTLLTRIKESPVLVGVFVLLAGFAVWWFFRGAKPTRNS